MVLWALAVLLWMLHVAGHDAPVLARGTIVLALIVFIAWLVVRIVQAWHAGSGRTRALVLLLPALLCLSLAVRSVGLSHEVDGRYYLDEGTYYHHANEIDKGNPLRLSFVYPHLMYYLDAFALWVTGMFPGVATRWAGALGVSDPLSVQWLALRGVVALLSALTVIPVFKIAERLGGSWAAGAASLLLIFSPLYNDGSHLNICDVPSAFFATLCMLWVARLIDEEGTRDYLLAGMCAGMAAGSKYPAGVVAAAIVTFAAVMPSMVVFPQAAFEGNRGIFFGVHQYGQGGWLGVMPDSNPRFYGGRLAESFGWVAVALGLTGFFLARRAELVRRLWLLPYPALFLALIS